MQADPVALKEPGSIIERRNHDTHNACIELERRHERHLLIISAVVSLVGIFTFLAATPLHADNIYSGASVGSDGTIYGWGVTDATSMVAHTTHMNSTLSSPNGRQTSGTTSGGDYSRIDLSLPNDDNDTGTYLVSSAHWAYCPYGGWFLNGNQTQGSASTAVCDFTITPGSATRNCDGSKQEVTFHGVPNPYYCRINQNSDSTTCSYVTSGNIDPDSTPGDTYCALNSVSGYEDYHISFFAGPPQSDGTAGKLNPTLSIQFYGASGPISHSVNAEIGCQ